jgi:hypothetical protein
VAIPIAGKLERRVKARGFYLGCRKKTDCVRRRLGRQPALPAQGGQIGQGASAEKLASSLLKSMKNHSLYQFFYFNFNDYFLYFPEIPSL